MAKAYTLPTGHIWLSDAFERAWHEIEDNEKIYLALARREADKEFSKQFGGNWVSAPREAWQNYDESRRRVERLMRTAFASGRFRAMIRDATTGEPAELGNRETWIDAISFGVPGLSTQLHHLTCPGPETGGASVFVRVDELEIFIRAYLPTKSDTAAVDLISRVEWHLPWCVEEWHIENIPGGDWILLEDALLTLNFGTPSPPIGFTVPQIKAHSFAAGAALLAEAKQGRIKMFGTCAAGGRPEIVPAAVFAHDLIISLDCKGFDINPVGGMETYERWRSDQPHGLRWHDVTVSRSSLKAWVASMTAAESKTSTSTKRAAMAADINALKAAYDDQCPNWRTSDAWRKAHRSEVSRESFRKLWQASATTLKRGRR